MEMSLKFAMAQTIAQKIVDNPGWFPDLVDPASGMLAGVYMDNWGRRQEAWDRDEIQENFWPRIKARMPEILERINSLDNDER